MQFNDLLETAKISPTEVLVLRHRPKEIGLRKVLPWLANESHALYDAFQQAQGPIVEKALSWWRWSDRNELAIHSILEDSILVREMPEWTDLTLAWKQIEVLPEKWRVTLSQWRGIYFILDLSDGRGYVGAAYGKDNIYGRWRNYSKTGHGGNKLLRARLPDNLIFSILQRVSPDMDSNDVQTLEASWKDRLHTRSHGLNDN